MEIRAEAKPAIKSYAVKVDISDVVSIETIRPTALPTSTPQPTATANSIPTSTVESQTTPPAAGTLTLLRASLPGFVITFIGLLLVGTVLFGILTTDKASKLNTTTRLRIAIALWLAGWLAYALVAIGLPGTRWLTNALGWGGSVMAAVIIAVVGAGIVVAAAQFNARAESERVDSDICTVLLTY